MWELLFNEVYFLSMSTQEKSSTDRGCCHQMPSKPFIKPACRNGRYRSKVKCSESKKLFHQHTPLMYHFWKFQLWFAGFLLLLSSFLFFFFLLVFSIKKME